MPRRGSLWWWWLMGVGLATLVVVPFTLWIDSTPRSPTAATSAPLPQSVRVPGDCSVALGQVRQYRAPGQAAPLDSVVPRELAADRRPTQVEGWQSHGAEGATCVVGFVAWVGNERYHLRWRYYPDSGYVEALDPLTRRLSGW
jgi:hypothetical protein